MFDSSIELKSSRLTFRGDIEEVKTSLISIDKEHIQNLAIEAQISFYDVDEYNAFIQLTFKEFINKHIILNISSSIFDTVNIEPITKNFLIKNIQFLKGSIQINLYKPEKIIPEIINNNYKIYNIFINNDLYYWNPTYNSVNELLVLSNNLLDEYNQTLLDKKEINNKMLKVKSIVKDL